MNKHITVYYKNFIKKMHFDALYYKSKFLWDTHPADHEINRLICDINLGTEKRELKAYPSLSLRVACSVVVSNCNASYWHVLAFNSCF